MDDSRAPAHEPEPVPPGKLAALILGLGVFAGAAATVDARNWWAVSAGILAILVGGVFTVLANRRLRAENRGYRLPLLFGNPPVRPRKIDLLSGLGMPLAVTGALMIGRGASVLWPLPIIAIGIVLLAYSAATIVLHNRRATSDA